MAPLPSETHIAPLETVDSYQETKTIDSDNADEALHFLQQNQHVENASEVNDKKLMRKVDWMLMPLFFAAYYLQYSDKTLSMVHYGQYRDHC